MPDDTEPLAQPSAVERSTGHADQSIVR
jgi:hypothetical protein